MKKIDRQQISEWQRQLNRRAVAAMEWLLVSHLRLVALGIFGMAAIVGIYFAVSLLILPPKLPVEVGRRQPMLQAEVLTELVNWTSAREAERRKAYATGWQRYFAGN